MWIFTFTRKSEQAPLLDQFIKVLSDHTLNNMVALYDLISKDAKLGTNMSQEESDLLHSMEDLLQQKLDLTKL